MLFLRMLMVFHGWVWRILPIYFSDRMYWIHEFCKFSPVKLHTLLVQCPMSILMTLFTLTLQPWDLWKNIWGLKNFIFLGQIVVSVHCTFIIMLHFLNDLYMRKWFFCDMLVDNGPRQGLDKFLKAASDNPDTVLHYEFMQDYKVIRIFRHIFLSFKMNVSVICHVKHRFSLNI